MNRRGLTLIAIIGLIAYLAMGFWPDVDYGHDLPKTVDFNYHIRPILSQQCFVCHGNDPSSREADLRLDIEDGAKARLGHGGKAIVEGNINKSLLIERITSDDPKFMMPPPDSKKVMSPREIALLKKWIKQGAEWKEQWAFVTPQLPKVPLLNNNPSVSVAIDYFINDALEQKDLSIADQADRNTLIRRVSYILTGLPPTIEELDTYLNDESDSAYESMLDRYLASSGYGERWARHWMDLVRYGESMGHEGDFNISNAWEYRDYLIRAFNQDVPYDQFVLEHLAGDQITETRINPQDGYNESAIGTAYLFLGDGKHSPVNTREEESDKIDNMIEVTSKTFQALTVSCSRCHDHKFDPIPTADYYAMYGMFESTRLVPKPARMPVNRLSKADELMAVKSKIRSKVGDLLLTQLESTTQEDQRTAIQKYVAQIDKSQTIELDTSLQLLADFRAGDWEGWYTDGIAFGEHPAKGDFTIDKESKKLQELGSGFATSRHLALGVHGVLSSPNFTINKEYIAVRAAGQGGTVRIVIDNFQVIQAPLWGQLKANVDDPDWKTYILDVRLAKGRKAYLEFFSGSFERHVFDIQPDDYVDVQYAVAFSGEHDIKEKILAEQYHKEILTVEPRKAIEDWVRGESSMDQTKLVGALRQEWLPDVNTAQLSNEINQLSTLSTELYDSTHFIGMMEGEAIHSPVFNRGSFDDLSDENVPHRFLSVVSAGPDSFPQDGSGRLAWAESLVDPTNPLTSRVMVNRIWHHVFGKGIVETVDNFGLQGKMPTHPDLLNYLAITFIEEGWSIKGLIKQVLLSETFKQSSIASEENTETDPNNEMLHHYPVRRLEAEAIRDGILAAAGCLDRQMFGPSVPVHLTNFMTGRGRPRVSGPLDSYGRRSIYRSVRRNFIPPLMQTFDMPIPFSTFGKRNTTNVPAQSLALLNDPFIHEQAEYWAQNILSLESASLEERINTIYKRAFSREATQDEQRQAVQFLELQAAAHGSSLEQLKDSDLLWKDYCHSIFNLKEFIHLL